MIESIIELIQKTHSPSTDENLMGFVQDMDYALWKHKAFKKCKTKRTSDPNCLIRACVKIAAKVRSVQEIADAFEKIGNEIGYNELKVISIKWYSDATVLRFVTAMHGADLFVTGTVVASGRRYPKLVESYNAEYGEWHGNLEPYPGGLPDWASHMF